MRLRQLVLACGFSSLVLSHYASALGLGEVTLKSTLNQPLSAEVKLLDTRDLSAEQILVTLAAPADFERNGVDRLFFYTELQFEVVLDAPDGPKVLITSRNPVREPYMNFLIEARWTAGRLLREYTLLMDLPTFAEDQGTRAVESSTAGYKPQSNNYATPARPAARQASSPSRSVAPAPSLSGDEYQIKSNDTLWEIAQRMGSGSVHQNMMALYKANPDAFIKGNINLLRRGQVLRVPTADEVNSISRREAVSQFAQQTNDTALGAQLNASRRDSVSRSESTGVSGRVKLAAPVSGSAGAGQGSGANDGSGKALESELATTLEELDKSKAENSELSSRVKELEAQIDTMERLVDVSNEKLRALQVAAEQQGQAVSANTAEPVVSIDEPAVANVEPVVSEPEVESKPVAEEPEVKPVVAPPKPMVQPPVRIPTMVDKLNDNAPWLGLGALALAVAGFLVYRRRKEAAEEDVSFEDEAFTADASFDEPTESLGSDLELDEPSADLFEEDEQPVEAETGDVVGEADIYIAYGKLDQAEEMLLKGLNKDPQSADIRLKLLEVYAQQENAKEFDKHYAGLLPLATGAVLARASELRAGIAGAGEFNPESFDVSADDDLFANLTADDVKSTSANSALSAEDFNVDDFQIDDDALALDELEADSLGDELNFDLDLSDDFVALDADSDSASASSATELAEETLDFNTDDLDLDFDFEGEDETLDGADDLSALSLALSEIDAEKPKADEDITATDLTDDEFSFDLDDDSSLTDDLLAVDSAKPAVAVKEEQLDVAADDFDLDKDVNEVDLAALDHEMESLDFEMDDDLESLASEEGVALDFEGELDLEEELADFESAFDEDTASVGESLKHSGLVLTDDLDVASVASSPVDSALDDDFNLEDETELDLADTDELESVDLVDVDAELISSAEKALESDASTDELDELSFDSELAGDLDGSLELNVDEELAVDSFDLEYDDVADSLAELAAGLDETEADTASNEVVAEDEALEEDLFAQALSDFSDENTELNLDDFDSSDTQLADLSDEDMDSELDYLADADESATKLDLARAYIDMGDIDGAKDILAEVVSEGTEEQRKEATGLLGGIDA